MIIREETPADFSAVYRLVQDAFATAEHSDGNEQDLVEALRGGESFVAALSLVAELDGEIVGHILFTKGHVGAKEVLILAPLSVSPKHQKKGIGTALMNEGHKIARALGYQYSLVLGSEHYYPRVGYAPASSFGVLVPEGIPSENFMAMRLAQDAPKLSGAVRYPKEFGL